MDHQQLYGPFDVSQQFLAGGSFTNWVRLLRENGGLEKKYLLRGMYISMLTLLLMPFRRYEEVKFGEQIEQTAIKEPPIFIIGHWRSGTTHLHRLIGQDPALAFPSLLQTIVPNGFLSSGLLRWILKESAPEKRAMDNVILKPEFAEEEEYALANLSPIAFYHGFCFPKQMRPIFERYVLFEGVEQEVIQEWQRLYLYFVKKITFCEGGKRLLLKNPANTGRIKALLELFPDAKFIHIYRNPYIVFASTMNWISKELSMYNLQDVSPAEIEAYAFENYERLMKKYFSDNVLIPEGHLSEVSFEAFEAEPLREVERIYRELELPGVEGSQWQQTQGKFRDYLTSVAGYKKNTYHLDDTTIQKVNQRWGFAIEKWGYQVPNG